MSEITNTDRKFENKTEEPCCSKSITSTIKLLSGKELVLARTDQQNFKPPIKSNREVFRTNTEEQNSILCSLYLHLENLLSSERVDRSINRSQGVWEPENDLIKVTQIKGDWKIYGIVRDKIHYLRPFEGLYLMEMNNLEVYYNSVIVSIEQGYEIFLNTANSLSLKQYTVYAKLMRGGYNLQKFDPTKIPSTKKFQLNNNSNKNTKNDSLWKWLFFNLNPPNPTYNVNELDQNLVQSLNSIKEKTTNFKYINAESEIIEEPFNWNQKIVPLNNLKRKRKLKKYYPMKKQFLDYPTDSLIHENNYFNNRDIFDLISFIELKDFDDDYELNNCRCYKYDFDLYISSKNFKKSEYIIPNYRIVIVNAEEKLPLKYEMKKLYDSHEIKIPILVILFTQFYNFTGFVYNFHCK